MSVDLTLSDELRDIATSYLNDPDEWVQDALHKAADHIDALERRVADQLSLLEECEGHSDDRKYFDEMCSYIDELELKVEALYAEKRELSKDTDLGAKVRYWVNKEEGKFYDNNNKLPSGIRPEGYRGATERTRQGQ